MKNTIQEYWGTKTKDEVKFQLSLFTVDNFFDHTLFVATPIIGEELKIIENYHVGSLNHLVGGLIYNTVQTPFDFQYLTTCLRGYMNSPIEPALLALIHGM